MGSNIDCAAPGENILSTYLNNKYVYADGTSMSSAIVSGVSSLLASKGYSNQQIRTSLESSCVDLGPANDDIWFGNGRIDALNAVQFTQE